MLPPSAWSLVGRPPEPVRPRYHHIESTPTRAEAPALTMRRARPEDGALLSALAALDSAPPLDGDVLVAEVGGAPIAAIELATGRAIADPFTPSSEAVLLLRLRAEQLRAPARVVRRRRRAALAHVAGLLR